MYEYLQKKYYEYYSKLIYTFILVMIIFWFTCQMFWFDDKNKWMSKNKNKIKTNKYFEKNSNSLTFDLSAFDSIYEDLNDSSFKL